MIIAYPQKLKFHNRGEFSRFIKNNSVKIYDCYKSLASEKFLNDHPKIYFSTLSIQKEKFIKYFKKLSVGKNLYNLGTWVYHPWSKKLFHLLNNKEYLLLRTIRNRNIIRTNEQTNLYQKIIAIAGLSVGSNILLSFIRHGIGNFYKIADKDNVALSNINRAQFDLNDLGKNKSTVTAEQLHKIDPFIKVDIYNDGLTSAVLENFMSNADLIVDTFDDFKLKIELRRLAKKKKIPVLSGFDIERAVLVIVERYDLDKDLDTNIFLNNYRKNLFTKHLKTSEKTKLFINIIGKKYHSSKMLQSVKSVGKTLSGYPQFIIATLLAASTFTVIAENILSGKATPSYRKYLSLENMLR